MLSVPSGRHQHRYSPPENPIYALYCMQGYARASRCSGLVCIVGSRVLVDLSEGMLAGISVSSLSIC